jgi:hypothetical protein
MYIGRKLVAEVVECCLHLVPTDWTSNDFQTEPTAFRLILLGECQHQPRSARPRFGGL